MRLLVFRFSALGDVALTVPVIASLAAAHPEHHFIVVTRPRMEALFATLGTNVEVHAVAFDGTYKGFGGLLRLARHLRRTTRPDAVADLHDVLRTKVLRTLLRLSGIPVAVIRKGRKDKQALVAHRLSSPLPHVTERYLDVFRQLGIDAPLNFSHLPLDPLLPAEETAMRIGIAPFAAHEGKIYPVNQMRTVAFSLLEADERAQVYLFGSPKEMEGLRADWAHPRLHFVCDLAHDLTDELRLMRQLSVMVSMDSANLHLASLVACPVVSVWGATHPHAGFTGYRQRPEDIVQLPLPCRPCSVYGNRPCRFGDLRCLARIAPEVIVRAVRRHLPVSQR